MPKDIIDRIRAELALDDEHQSLGDLSGETANVIEVLRRTLLQTCLREEAKRVKIMLMREALEDLLNSAFLADRKYEIAAREKAAVALEE